jgi:hypothetical protein
MADLAKHFLLNVTKRSDKSRISETLAAKNRCESYFCTVAVGFRCSVFVRSLSDSGPPYLASKYRGSMDLIYSFLMRCVKIYNTIVNIIYNNIINHYIKIIVL